MAELEKRYAYSGGNVEYIGEARPGTSPATAEWRIKKLTYSGTDPVVESWADGTDDFIKSWALRTSYTYITS